jgi:hypothetical protein
MAVRSLDQLPTFANGNVFHVVVESPRGSAIKLKYSATLGAMTISRPLALGHCAAQIRCPLEPPRGVRRGPPINAALCVAGVGQPAVGHMRLQLVGDAILGSSDESFFVLSRDAITAALPRVLAGERRSETTRRVSSPMCRRKMSHASSGQCFATSAFGRPLHAVSKTADSWAMVRVSHIVHPLT